MSLFLAVIIQDYASFFIIFKHDIFLYKLRLLHFTDNDNEIGKTGENYDRGF